jgi:hypothetical protein
VASSCKSVKRASWPVVRCRTRTETSAPHFCLSNIAVPGTGFATIFFVGMAPPIAMLGLYRFRGREEPQLSATKCMLFRQPNSNMGQSA